MKDIRVSHPSEFRHLNDQEQDAIVAWLNRGKATCIEFMSYTQTRVSYHRTQGGFTICTLACQYVHPNRGLSVEIRTGASRRSFKDPINPIKGKMLALFRAVNSKPVTLP